MNRIGQFLIIMAVMFFSSCTSDNEVMARTNQTTEAMKINITIGNQTMSATLVDNTSAQALYEALQQGNITFEAHDYGDFEKVGDMGRSFPQNNEQITTQPGDLILYLGNNFSIYHDINSWNFTRLGRIDGATKSDIMSFVKAGQGNVTVTLSLPTQSSGTAGITESDIRTEGKNVSVNKTGARQSGLRYTFSGRCITETPKRGIYIENGIKKSVR